MLQLKICALIFLLCLTREIGCPTTLQGQMTIPTAQDVGQAVNNAGNWAGNKVQQVGTAAGNLAQGAGNVVGKAAQGAGNVAGNVVQGAGNVAGNVVSGAGNVAGKLAQGVGSAAGHVVNGAGNVIQGAGNLANYVVTAGGQVLNAAGQVVGAAGQGIANAAMFPINQVQGSYNALQMRMTQLQLQMASYKQAMMSSYNMTTQQYQYQSAMLDSIAMVDLQPYVDNVNKDLAPYGQMVRLTRTAGGENYIFPTIYDASGTALSLPNGFSIQGGNIINARGMNVGSAPTYQPSYNGQVLQDPTGNQYVLGNDIYLDQSGNLRYRQNNQPWAVAGQYVIDLGGNVYDSTGNIIGNLCRCIGITGSFGPNGSIVLT